MSGMKVFERLRRWWKPAEYDDGRPLSEKERTERKPRDFFDETTKLDGYTVGGRAIDPNDEFRR
jgi:hypothetical protein